MIPVLIAAAFLAQQVSAPPPAKARVAGSVINSSNGEAVRKATVILRAHDPEHALSYAGVTDGNGHFSIGEVEPGEYALVAERPGFSQQSTGATGAPLPSVKVEEGQQIDDVSIRLTPLGAIAGRVLEADGDPVRGATVKALRYVYSDGKRQLRSVEQVQSGDHGDFRLFGLRPGTFYIQVERNITIDSAKNISAYYPGTPDQSHAAPVELNIGAHLQGFDIRLPSVAGHSVRFRFAEGRPPDNGFSATLVNEQGPNQFGIVISPDNLAFVDVPPGSYEAVLTIFDAEKPRYAFQHVEVANADVEGAALTFVPAVEVIGSVHVDGGTLSGYDKLRILLRSRSTDFFTGEIGADVRPDGSFLLNNAAPTTYEVVVSRSPGVYLKSLRLGDKTLPDRSIDLTAQLGPLTVVLGTDVGAVEGSVQNAKGEPLARARVNLIAYGNHANRSDFNRFGFTDEKGAFTIKDVPPGDYKVFAWEDVPVGAPQDPEFRKPFEKQAAALRLEPNGHAKLQLTAIPAEATRGNDR